MIWSEQHFQRKTGYIVPSKNMLKYSNKFTSRKYASTKKKSNSAALYYTVIHKIKCTHCYFGNNFANWWLDLKIVGKNLAYHNDYNYDLPF